MPLPDLDIPQPHAQRVMVADCAARLAALALEAAKEAQTLLGADDSQACAIAIGRSRGLVEAAKAVGLLAENL